MWCVVCVVMCVCECVTAVRCEGDEHGGVRSVGLPGFVQVKVAIYDKPSQFCTFDMKLKFNKCTVPFQKS